MVYVFDILDEFDSKICDLIESCGDITITEEDPYSKHICGNCLNELANATRFRQRCLRTMDVLLNMTIETNEPIKSEIDEYQPHTESEEVEDMRDRFIEELIMEQVEDGTEAEEATEFPENLESNDDCRSTNIQYIIAEEQTVTDLQNIDYDNLITIPHKFKEEIETICVEELDSIQEPDKLVSILQPVQKETRVARPRPIQLNFVCQHCGAGFAMQKNLSKHLLIHRNYACEVCSIVFKSGQDLAAHQLIHAKDHSNSPMDDTEQETKKCQNPKKNHPCSYCGKAFASNSALVAHVRVHTQERPFPCSYCQKRFRTVGALELHERRHSGVKPYKCDFCGKGFAESSNLKVHRRIHTQEKPHVCTICNRAFSRVFLLQIHQRTHTGERPFSCEDCGKPFNQQGDLAAHRRTHTGERPHQCDICGKGFIKSSGLTLHRKKHEQQQHTEKVHMVLIDTKDYGLPTSEHAVVDIAPDDMVIEDVIISS